MKPSAWRGPSPRPVRPFAAVLLAALLAACPLGGKGGRRGGTEDAGGDPGRRGPGRLTARPQGSPEKSPPLGLQPLGLSRERDAYAYVPRRYDPSRPAPLVVMLHGAGGDALGGLQPLQEVADEAGLIVMAPASRHRTWDVIGGAFGADLRFLDSALAGVFARYAVDPARLAIGGFSDGASYALSVGITNGDLFTHVIAFSPGFSAPARAHGSPHVFVSHGRGDDVLPIRSTSRRIVPVLRDQGYEVRYREFDGGHAVPRDVVGEAVAWFTGATGGPDGGGRERA